jgi:hypothetical protein
VLNIEQKLNMDAANTNNNSAAGQNGAHVNYTEMNEADTAVVVDIAVSAIRLHDKSEKPIYHRDIAQAVKEQLDSTKG